MAGRRDNNFDFLRFLFAACVIFSHAYLLSTGGKRDDFLFYVTRGQLNVGKMALAGFFAISGFLITASWTRSAGAWEYGVKRALRILPGLYVCILFCIFIIGPLNVPSVSVYFHSLTPRSLLVGLARMGVPDLPGVFQHLPVGSVDGVLWTVVAEFKLYIMVALLGLLGAYRKPATILALFALSLGMVAWKMLVPHSPFSVEHSAVHFWGNLAEWPRLFSAYTAGMAAYLYRDRIPFSPVLCVASAAALALSCFGGLPLVLPIAGAYLLFYFAYNKAIPLQAWGRHGDFSYGLYLYSWPVQQSLVQHFHDRLPPLALFAASMVLTLALAALSWRVIEKPFLRLKPRSGLRKPESVAPTLVPSGKMSRRPA